MNRSFFSLVWLSALAVLIATSAAQAQTGLFQRLSERSQPQPMLATPESPVVQTGGIVDPMVKQASGCCGLSAFHNGSGFASRGGSCGDGRCGNGGGGNCGEYGCIPGRRPCHGGCDDDSWFGRVFGCILREICCPDPCYEPRWIAEANAAFFQISPRPVTQTRLRWDAGFRLGRPDTAEFFWAKIGGKGPKVNTPFLHYNDLTLTQEIAAKGASVVIEIPYRTVDPNVGPGGSGMGDMSIGAKSVLLDSELLLASMQITTFVPTGNFTSGTGTGHVSIEPALLTALKLAPTTYAQSELALWIPIGGTNGHAGTVFHYHASLNHNLYQYGNVFGIIGTLELNGYNFRGSFTNFPGGAVIGAGGRNYVNAGPGVRVHICDHFDFGVGMAFGFDRNHGPGHLYRTEMRVRY